MSCSSACMHCQRHGHYVLQCLCIGNSSCEHRHAVRVYTRLLLPDDSWLSFTAWQKAQRDFTIVSHHSSTISISIAHQLIRAAWMPAHLGNQYMLCTWNIRSHWRIKMVRVDTGGPLRPHTCGMAQLAVFLCRLLWCNVAWADRWERHWSPLCGAHSGFLSNKIRYRYKCMEARVYPCSACEHRKD